MVNECFKQCNDKIIHSPFEGYPSHEIFKFECNRIGKHRVSIVLVPMENSVPNYCHSYLYV